MISLCEKYRCECITKELDELIKEALCLFDSFSPCRTSGHNIEKINQFETIILNHLIGKTNFKNNFDSLKKSYGNSDFPFHTEVYHLLCEIGKKGLDPTFDNLLEVLNDRITELRELPIEKYTYYIPTRIESQLNKSEFNILKKSIKKALGISLTRIPKNILDEIQDVNYKNLLKNRKIIIKFEIKSRDYKYPIKILNDKIYTFLGALMFSNNSGGYIEKINFSNDMSIESLPIEDYITIVENKKIIYPNKESPSPGINEVSLINKSIFIIHNRENGNYKLLKKILDCLGKQNKNILKISEDSLKLYSNAIAEKQIEISFLKFWIITEIILKLGEKKKDTYLINFMKEIIKDPFLKNMIDELHIKRNNLVHEFLIDYITQQDRNLAKTISENIIYFLISLPIKINNIKELRILFDNVFSSRNELKKKKFIINKIIRFKNE